jgi:putative ABC transport system permease protein
VPLSGGGGFSRIVIEGRPSEPGKEPGVGFTAVSPHMLEALGLSVIRGRALTATEAMTRTPYAVVNQAMVKRFWPNDDPIGRRFRTLDENAGTWFTIVGVAPDFRHGELDNADPIDPCAYVSFAYGAFPNTGLTIRVAGDPGLIAAPAREAIRASDPRMAVFQAATMKELRQRGYWQYFLFGWMFSLFGGIALLLAAIGVYGVLSYSVAQRTQEIGVRMALGATASDVRRLVLGEGLRLAVTGAAIGSLGAIAAGRVLRGLLFGVQPLDPVALVGAAVLLALVAALACELPARRAMRLDPLVVLRDL